jgi:hypothetical protein
MHWNNCEPFDEPLFFLWRLAEQGRGEMLERCCQVRGHLSLADRFRDAHVVGRKRRHTGSPTVSPISSIESSIRVYGS